MGYSWHKETYSSDCFNQLYLWALELIKLDHAYIDSQDSDMMLNKKEPPLPLAQIVQIETGLLKTLSLFLRR